jgi:hypothetical protein
VTGVIVASFLLGAGVAAAQTGAPPAGSGAQAIIPVMGPSVGPSLSESAKPELVPVSIPRDAKTGEIAPKSGTGRVASTGHPAPRTVKAGHKPGARSTVKKTSSTRHVAKTAGSAKPKHVAATTKHKTPAHHTMVGKPVPVSKHQPATPVKGAAPAQPVLPRV